MNKRGNYFIAMYDLEDNYICDFDSIEQCALFFKTTKQTISNYIFKKQNIKNKYNLFKINNLEPVSFNKERVR